MIGMIRFLGHKKKDGYISRLC